MPDTSIHAALHLSRFLIGQGCTLSLVGGGELLVHKTTNAEDILKGCREVDDLCILTALKGGEKVARAVLLADGPSTCSPEETVVDYSISPLMDQWDDQFSRITT